MPSPIDSTWPTSATSASLPKWAISCLRIAEISAARISIQAPSTYSANSSGPHGRACPAIPAFRLKRPKRGSPGNPRLSRHGPSQRNPGAVMTTIRLADLRDPRSADALHRQLQPLQFALDGSVHHPRTYLDDHPADQPRVDRSVHRDPASGAAAQLIAQPGELSFAQRLRGDDLRGDLATPFCELCEIDLDHRRHGEQASVLRDDGEEIADQPRETGMCRQRPNGLSLFAARQDGAAQQARKIDARGQHRAQLTQVGRDLVERPPLVGEVEQGGGVTLSQAGDARRFGGQLNAVPIGCTGERAAAAFPRYQIAARRRWSLSPNDPRGC